jgi:hypothetical protein
LCYIDNIWDLNFNLLDLEYFLYLSNDLLSLWFCFSSENCNSFFKYYLKYSLHFHFHFLYKNVIFFIFLLILIFKFIIFFFIYFIKLYENGDWDLGIPHFWKYNNFNFLFL